MIPVPHAIHTHLSFAPFAKLPHSRLSAETVIIVIVEKWTDRKLQGCNTSAVIILAVNCQRSVKCSSYLVSLSHQVVGSFSFFFVPPL